MTPIIQSALAGSKIWNDMPTISRSIWDMKYRLKDDFGNPIDLTPEDSIWRVARALAQAESNPKSQEINAKLFYDVMANFEYLPAGRILAGAGSGRNVTLSNCYVMGTIPDSMSGIFTHLREAALTMQAGGGIGYDFSPLRPKGAEVKGVGADASGPLSFMDVWDAMCRTVMSAGSRRGAMMATMDCSHPDIIDFIRAKQDGSRLRMFNVSVLCSDAFMEAVFADEDWELFHAVPPRGVTAPKEKYSRPHHGASNRIGFVYKTVRAKELWDLMTRSTYDAAEPGVIFIDRINRLHNLWWIDNIRATNPCGEKAMGPYDSCLLGSVNLTRLVKNPFGSNAHIDYERMKVVVTTAIRMMDNVIDVNYFPLEAQRQKANETRQLGLGITGLADALIMIGVTYGTDDSLRHAAQIMKSITGYAYQASIYLAKERGSFPAFDRDKYLSGDSFAATILPRHYREQIYDHGIRNSLLTSIAPTGTISIYAHNVSSGMEPVFDFEYERKVLKPDGTKVAEPVEDYALRLWRDLHPGEIPPATFVSAQTLTPTDHVDMQGTLQKWVDSSISKTINVPEDISFEDFQDVYKMAWEAGCKGCTTYRPNAITGSVLTASAPVDFATSRAEGMENQLHEEKDLTAFQGTRAEFEKAVSTPDWGNAFDELDEEQVNALNAERDRDLMKQAMEYFADSALPVRITTDVGFSIEGKALSFVFNPEGPHDLHLVSATVERSWEWAQNNEEKEFLDAVRKAKHDLPPLDDEALRQHILTGYRNDPPAIQPDRSHVEFTAKLTAPPDVLESMRYRIKIGSMDHAVYVNISNITENGQTRPFEIFCSTKDPSHLAWMTALTRMVSAIFRRPYDSSFVVKELKAVFDPTFSGFMDGKSVPSVIAAIGMVIETHMKSIGYMKTPIEFVLKVEDKATEKLLAARESVIDSISKTTGIPGLGGLRSGGFVKGSHGGFIGDKSRRTTINPAVTAPYGATSNLSTFRETLKNAAVEAHMCPKCFSTRMKRESSCETCMDCGHSKCG